MVKAATFISAHSNYYYPKDALQSQRSYICASGIGNRYRKSTVPQTVGVFTCGVTLVLENILSLGAYQRSKFSNASQIYGPVLAYQLDSLIVDEDVNSVNLTLVNL